MRKKKWNELVKIAHLKGAKNWASWKFQVPSSILLNASGAWSVVNSETIRPVAVPNSDTMAMTTYEREAAAWLKSDRIGQKTIGTSVGPQALLHIINCETAAEMWNKLKSVYEQKSKVNIHMLQQMWYSAKMSPTDIVASYIAKLKDIAHKLEVMGEKVFDNMIITKILMTSQLSSFRKRMGVGGSN